jgi:hypothetical protein
VDGDREVRADASNRGLCGQGNYARCGPKRGIRW